MQPDRAPRACADCPEPVKAGRTRCAACLAKRSAALKRPGSDSYACSYCAGAGHNVRSCTAKAADDSFKALQAGLIATPMQEWERIKAMRDALERIAALPKRSPQAQSIAIHALELQK